MGASLPTISHVAVTSGAWSFFAVCDAVSVKCVPVTPFSFAIRQRPTNRLAGSALFLGGCSPAPVCPAVTYRKGDRGGNDIPLRRGQNLHRLWDGLLGYDDEIPAVRRTTLRLLSDSELRIAGERAAESLDVEDWLQESHRMAKDVAYHPNIFEAVRTGEEHGYHFGTIELPGSYYSAAGAAAKRRIVEAGYRLGGILDKLAE